MGCINSSTRTNTDLKCDKLSCLSSCCNTNDNSISNRAYCSACGSQVDLRNLKNSDYDIEYEHKARFEKVYPRANKDCKKA